MIRRSLDDQQFMGNTATEMSREKGGIIRRGGVVVTLPQQPQANDVIGNTILDLEARAVNAVPYVPPVAPGTEYRVTSGGSGRAIFRYLLEVTGKRILVETPLLGRHQLR